MDSKEEKRISKLLSYVLRHHPEFIDIKLDVNGWANVTELLQKLEVHVHLNFEMLEQVVTNNSKQRFSFNVDNTMIRASQGHSIEVDIQASQKEPPEYLYHGTVNEYIEPIRREGLQKMERQYVHLSPDEKTAREVAGRRGKPVILKIKATELASSGIPFFLSDNGVWLVKEVPANFIIF